MSEIYNIITLGTATLLSVLVLMQSRGASLGAGFGGSGELHTTRRGADKTLHRFTILVAVVFVFSIILNIVTG